MRHTTRHDTHAHTTHTRHTTKGLCGGATDRLGTTSGALRTGRARCSSW
jgi:hypothetical protein